MPIVRVELWKGRDKETKADLIKKVTAAVSESVNCPQKAVTVVITDIEKENWGQGGEQASD